MTEEKLISEGKCVYCEETFNKQGITKHLNGHLKKNAKENPTPNRAFHIRAQADVYFLNILIDADLSLGDLDDFLQSIWLSCCGHLSAFTEKGKRYDSNMEWNDEGEEDDNNEYEDEDDFGESKQAPLSKVLRVKQKLKYEYDFGSTTQLEIIVLSEHNITVQDGILLLSRNEPLQIMCQACGKKPAKKICSVHGWGEPHIFCATCTTKHKKECEDAEYALLSVVNSPRMGVCAYEGGSIDTKRDGIWKEK